MFTNEFATGRIIRNEQVRAVQEREQLRRAGLPADAGTPTRTDAGAAPRARVRRVGSRGLHVGG
jgi:hypothetical protein